jgi:hypothetical protein
MLSKMRVTCGLAALVCVASVLDAAPIFDVRTSVCAYNSTVFNPTNCSTNVLFTNTTHGTPSATASASGSGGGPGGLNIGYNISGSSSPGVLQGVANATSTGSSSPWVSSVEAGVFSLDDLTIVAPAHFGTGTVTFGLNVSGDGLDHGASSGASSQVQLWYYVGAPSDFEWTLLDITGTSVNTTVLGSPIPFTFGQPFALRAALTARVDARCTVLATCGNWSAHGTADVSHTLRLTSILVEDAFGQVQDFSVSASSASEIYDELPIVPEPAPLALLAVAIGTAVARGLRLRRG